MESGLAPAVRVRLALQRELARLLSPLTTSVVAGLLRFGLGLRVARLREVRRAYRRLRRDSEAPLLICANHLTMVDSALIAWALGSPASYVRHFSALPWNVPERRIFADRPWQRALAYVLKCLPIRRGGPRREVADTLGQLGWLLGRGEVALVFPEGRRSRSGRVEVEGAAYGVGRLVRAVPGCRVLCVYLRGDRQRGHSELPARGDLLRISLCELEPKTDAAGLRGSRDVAHQITTRLSEMEREHFDARQ